MIVLVTGATGFLGRPLCAALAARGHAVRILTRNPSASKPVPASVPASAAPPPQAYPWNPPGPVPAEALEGVDAVIHLAGEPIGAWPWTSARMNAIRDSRILGTRVLVDSLAACANRPTVLISGSAVGFYGDAGDRECREADPAGQGFLADVAAGWEREAFRAASFGMRVATLRTGLVLDAGGGALAKMAPVFRMGGGAVLGSGRQWWSWIHRRDAVNALVFAVENGSVAGPANLTAPEPVRQMDFARVLVQALRRRPAVGKPRVWTENPPWLWPAPAWALRLGLGKMAETLLAGQRARPEKLQAAGYRFEFPNLLAALENIYPVPGPR